MTQQLQDLAPEDLLLEIINIESTTLKEKEVYEFLHKYLSSSGWEVQLQQVEENRCNVYAHRKGFSNPSILFNSHIDTVPPYIKGHKDETNVYGRGACDAKGQVVAQIKAAEKLVKEGIEDIGLLYVVGEETNHIGMIKANDLGLQPKYLIVGEPTESKLIRRQKGAVMITVDCFGKAAHSGYPEMGDSAIEKLVDVLADLKKETWPVSSDGSITTMNIGTITGGVAVNIVPASAKAQLAFRIIGPQDDILKRVQEIAGNRATVTRNLGNDPCDLYAPEEAGIPISIVAFNTDIPYFKFSGKPMLLGGGSILVAHNPEEKISISELHQCIDLNVQLVKSVL